MAAKNPCGRTLPSVFPNTIQESAHCHQLQTANVQTDDADERDGLGILLQNEYPHIVQPQFGGQHRAGRSAPGNDHVEHEGRAIGAGARRPESGYVVHGEVAFDRAVRRRLGGELRRVHRCCLSGVPCWRGTPGDTYVNRPTVTERGAPTSLQRSWVSPPWAVSRSTASYKSEHHPVHSFSQPRDHDSERASGAPSNSLRAVAEVVQASVDRAEQDKAAAGHALVGRTGGSGRRSLLRAERRPGGQHRARPIRLRRQWACGLEDHAAQVVADTAVRAVVGERAVGGDLPDCW